METKTFTLPKETFGGRILKRIKLLLKDKTANGFEVIILVRGLLNLNNLSLLHLMYIHVDENGDSLILNYPILN